MCKMLLMHLHTCCRLRGGYRYRHLHKDLQVLMALITGQILRLWVKIRLF